jgi:hypothetical protein
MGNQAASTIHQLHGNNAAENGKSLFEKLYLLLLRQGSTGCLCVVTSYISLPVEKLGVLLCHPRPVWAVQDAP